MKIELLKLFRTLAFIAGIYIMSNTKNQYIFYGLYIPLAIYFVYLGFLAVKLLVKLRLNEKHWKENDTYQFSWKYLLFQLLISLFLLAIIVSISWYGVLHKIWLFPSFAA